MKCYECKGHCNKKGYSSVTKGSAYCDAQRGIKKDGISRLQKIKNYILYGG